MAMAAAVLVPAALALACNPQAYLSLNKSQFAPGESVRVSGSFFKGDANITVSIDRTGQSATVRTTSNGAFQVTFALAGNAPTGGYAVQAIGYEASGEVINGLPARTSFSVVAAQSSAPPVEPTAPVASGPSAQPQASAPASQPAAAARPSARPGPVTSSPSSRFREPALFNEPGVQSSTAQGSGGERSAGTARADVVQAGGRAFFAGSVAPSVVTVPAPAGSSTATVAARAGASKATRSGSRSSALGRRAAEQTATDDVWGALGSGRSPSVLPVAGDGVAVSSPGSGSGLALGVLLLGVGALALVGGLSAGTARRRRIRSR